MSKNLTPKMRRGQLAIVDSPEPFEKCKAMLLSPTGKQRDNLHEWRVQICIKRQPATIVTRWIKENQLVQNNIQEYDLCG